MPLFEILDSIVPYVPNKFKRLNLVWSAPDSIAEIIVIFYSDKQRADYSTTPSIFLLCINEL